MCGPSLSRVEEDTGRQVARQPSVTNGQLNALQTQIDELLIALACPSSLH